MMLRSIIRRLSGSERDISGARLVLYELLSIYKISEMLDLHQQKHEYTHERNRIIDKISDFTLADEDIDSICLKNKEW